MARDGFERIEQFGAEVCAARLGCDEHRFNLAVVWIERDGGASDIRSGAGCEQEVDVGRDERIGAEVVIAFSGKEAVHQGVMLAQEGCCALAVRITCAYDDWLVHACRAAVMAA